VHPISQLEITHGKFGVVDMVIQGVAFWFIEPMMLGKLGIEPGNGIKPIPLKSMVQGFSKIEILQL
jgi:hypothetical protein